MLSLTDAEAGKPGGITLGSVDKKELADNLDIGDALNIADHLSQGYLAWCPEAEWVLRAQHARIKELEAKLDDMAGELMSLENSIRFEAGYGHN
jgi:hypothetical protein